MKDKVGKFSRDKGARGERLFASLCREHGYEASRTAQHSGKAAGVADVVGLPGVHVECKLQERLNLRDAMAQSVRDSETAGDGFPIVAHKKNNADWLITMRAHEWFELYREWECGR